MKRILYILAGLLTVIHCTRAQILCDMSNFSTVYCLSADDFPYTSPGSGITVSVIENLYRLNNHPDTCGGVTYSQRAPVFYLGNNTNHNTMVFEFSRPVSSFSVIVVGVENSEVLTFTPSTGAVTLSNFCPAGFTAAGNQLTCTTRLAGTLITVNNPAGAARYEITHNALMAGCGIALLDCFGGCVPDTTVVSQTICSGQSYTFGDSQYTTPQSNLLRVFQNAAGCDSVAILNLDVKLQEREISETICYGESYHFYGADVKETGRYDTLVRGNGSTDCDTLVRLYLEVTGAPVYDTLHMSACDSALYNSNVFYADTSVTDTLHYANGCDSIVKTAHIRIERFRLDVRYDPPEILSGDEVHFTTGSNIPSYRVYAWEPASWFKIQDVPQQRVSLTESGLITVWAATANGCIDSASVFVDVEPLQYQVLVPDAFSPNGDGLNDVFAPVVRKAGVYRYTYFRIFDRWGRCVFNGNAANPAWDGYYNSGNGRADIGTYHYHFEIEFANGVRKVFKGAVLLVR